jgi:hypothetical protein
MFVRRPSTSSFSSCSTTASIPRCNSAGSQRSCLATPARKPSAGKQRRQSNLADIQSDQENIDETLQRDEDNNVNGRKPKSGAGSRRTKSVQEKNKKLGSNSNIKTVRALSVTEKPVRVREDKKVKDNTMFKDAARAVQKNSISSPRLGTEEQ